MGTTRGKTSAKSTPGSFAPGRHDEPPDGVLSILPTPQVDWGTVGVVEGSRTPWGPAQSVFHAAPGIAQVSCAGHGGVKLSPERNRAIPPALRRSSGWYEEDCEAAIVGMYFPEAFPHASDPSSRWADSVKDYFPDQYESATGETVTADESTKRAQQEWEQAHSGQWAAVSASSVGDFSTVDVTVSPVGGSSTERKVLRMRRSDYNNAEARQPHGRYGGRWLAPDDHMTSGRYEDVTPPPPPPEPTFHGIAEGKTDTARRMIDKDLNQRWRGRDGQVRTLRSVIEEDGLTHKGVTIEGGKRSYYLGGQASAAYPVSRAMWDAVEAPDNRSQWTVAQQDVLLALDAVDRANDWEAEKAARKRLARARERRDALGDI